MKTACYVQSHIGTTRPGNEDNYFCCGSLRERVHTPLEELLQSPEGDTLLFAVFDGMGGEAAGEQASLLCAQTLSQMFLEGGSFEAPAFYHRANAAVTAFGQNLGSTSGSTAAVACLRANRLFASNVGDSRIYHLRGSVLRCLTHDHTRYQLLADSGYAVIEESERHVLTQFLGMGSQRLLSPHFAVSVPLEAGDRIMICSDGVSGTLDDSMILSLLKTPGGPEQAGRALVRESILEGSLDNVTALVLDVTELDDGEDILAESAPDAPVTRRFDLPDPEQIALQEQQLRRERTRELRRSIWLIVITVLAVAALTGGILYLALHYAPDRTAEEPVRLSVDAGEQSWYNLIIISSDDEQREPAVCAGREMGGIRHVGSGLDFGNA